MAKIERPRLIQLGVLGGFIGLTVVMTYPLAFHLTDQIPGGPGDNLHYVWLTWWFKHALIDLGRSPTFDPFVYVPEGFDMGRSEATWANTLLALPLTICWGPVVAYNVMFFLSFVLSGFATYLWVHDLTHSHGGGFIAGIILAFSTYRMAHYPGHLPLMATQWFPLTLLALEIWLHRRQTRFALAAAIFFGLNAWASWYYFYFSLIFIPLYLLLRFRDWPLRLRSADFWRTAGLMAVVVVCLIAPVAWPFLRFRETGQMAHTLATVDFWSANPTDFFTPNLFHPLWGEWLRGFFPFQWQLGVEKNISLGLFPLGLALIPLLKRWHLSPVRTLGTLAIIAFVLALGPTLHWAGEPVRLPLPGSVRNLLFRLGLMPYLVNRLDPTLLGDMRDRSYTFIPLPIFLFYQFVPFTSAMRAVSRFSLITLLCVAALAGWGVAILNRRWTTPPRRWTATTLIAGLILFELFALPQAQTTLQPRPIDRWLAQQPQGVMVELPVWQGLDPLKDYYATVNRQQQVFGPTGVTFRPATLFERVERLAAFPDSKSFEALRDYRTTYILVHTDFIEDPDGLKEAENRGWITLQTCFEALCAYTLEPEHD